MQSAKSKVNKKRNLKKVASNSSFASSVISQSKTNVSKKPLAKPFAIRKSIDQTLP